MARQVQITWEGDTGQTYNIALDATTSERHASPATITDHPVESGANTSDHIRPEPETLSLQGVVSNTPILLPTDHTDGASKIQVEVEGVGPSVRVPLPIAGALIGNIPLPGLTPKGHVLGFSPDFDRVAAVYEELLKIRNSGTLVGIITTLREYENMGIAMIEVLRDANSGNILALSLEFKEVQFGSTEEVPVPIIPRGKADKGTKAPKLSAPGGAERASALYNAFG